jgi:hypothetical protein
MPLHHDTCCHSPCCHHQLLLSLLPVITPPRTTNTTTSSLKAWRTFPPSWWSTLRALSVCRLFHAQESRDTLELSKGRGALYTYQAVVSWEWRWEEIVGIRGWKGRGESGPLFNITLFYINLLSWPKRKYPSGSHTHGYI